MSKLKAKADAGTKPKVFTAESITSHLEREQLLRGKYKCVYVVPGTSKTKPLGGFSCKVGDCTVVIKDFDRNCRAAPKFLYHLGTHPLHLDAAAKRRYKEIQAEVS